MIGDLCEPLNPGEHNTVRLIMNTLEAEKLLMGLVGIANPKIEEFKQMLLNILKRESEEIEDHLGDNDSLRALAEYEDMMDKRIAMGLPACPELCCNPDPNIMGSR